MSDFDNLRREAEKLLGKETVILSARIYCGLNSAEALEFGVRL